MGREIDNYYGPYRTYQADDGDLDYILIYGPTIPEVVAKLATLIGRMALPPRWSLGYLGSTMQYTEAPDAPAPLARFVALCAEHDIPCDGFHLSSGYTTGADGKRYVFEWNRDKVPGPQEMIATFQRAGMHVIAIPRGSTWNAPFPRSPHAAFAALNDAVPVLEARGVGSDKR